MPVPRHFQDIDNYVHISAQKIVLVWRTIQQDRHWNAEKPSATLDP